MSKRSFIDSVEVGKPCSENWNEMSGNERVRFCSHCSKHVNNLSELTRKEAMRFVRASGKNICIRYITDPVTRRPMFAEQLLQITRRTPGLAAGVMTASLALSTQTLAQQTLPTASPVVVTAPTTPQIKTNETPSGTQVEQRLLVDLPVESRTFTMGLVAVARPRAISNPLTSAVENEDIDEVRELIAGGAKVNGKEEDRSTPIFAAVENGNLEIVELLLDLGARLNLRNDEKQTPLMQLDDDATAELVDLLVLHGAKVDLVDDDGDSALIIASRSASSEVIKSLIDAGADVNTANKEGVTALMSAAEKGDVESVRLLLLAGAQANARDENGDNAWQYSDNEEIEQLLVSFGSETNETSSSGSEDEPSEQQQP